MTYALAVEQFSRLIFEGNFGSKIKALFWNAAIFLISADHHRFLSRELHGYSRRLAVVFLKLQPSVVQAGAVQLRHGSGLCSPSRSGAVQDEAHHDDDEGQDIKTWKLAEEKSALSLVWCRTVQMQPWFRMAKATLPVKSILIRITTTLCVEVWKTKMSSSIHW